MCIALWTERIRDQQIRADMHCVSNLDVGLLNRRKGQEERRKETREKESTKTSTKKGEEINE